MRSTSEIRERGLKQLHGMLARPRMYSAREFLEGTVREQLEELAFIDKREKALDREFDRLKEHGLWSALGMHGVLAGALGPASSEDNLVANYARVASALSYWTPQRRLTREALDAAEHGWDRGTRFATIEARLGPPSFKTAGQTSDVLAYAGPDDSAWLFFHFQHGELVCISPPRYPFGRHFIDLREPELGGPEEVFREFLVASFSGDEARIRSLIVERHDPSELWRGSYPPGVAENLAGMFREVAVLRVQPIEEIIYLAAPGAPALPVVREAGGWRVDPEPLLRFRAVPSRGEAH